MSRALENILKSCDKLPDLDKWNPPFCGHIDMRIAQDGQWFYMGSPIHRLEMVKLFSRVLSREGDEYFLKTPHEKIGIIVDDAPFVVHYMEKSSITVEDRQQWGLVFETNVGDVVVAGADHALKVVVDHQTDAPNPYLHIRHNLWGRLSRSVFYELVDAAHQVAREPDNTQVLVVESLGHRFELGQI